MEPEPPDRIDHYVLVTRIGSGAAADIYRAIDCRSGDVVTLKVPRQTMMANPELVRRFRREAVITAQLDHPLIQRNLDDRGHRSRPYLALEYLEGSNLRTELAGIGGRGAEDQVRHWMTDVAQALDHVHSRGFVHGDVKPENLVIGADRRARLIDFGDATDEHRRRPRWALMSGLQGTPEYLSPEQILGRGARPPSDLYALGVIAFELLVGSPPFLGRDPEATLNAHLTDSVPTALMERADLSDGLVTLVHDLLRRSPRDRPPSARSVLERLETLDSIDCRSDRSRRLVADHRLRGTASSAARRQTVAAVASIAGAFVGIVTVVIAASVLLR